METEQKDHSYTNGVCDQINPAEFTYKMSKKEVEDFVKLRISNSYLFSGRKNSSKWAWRAILKHMGLHFKMTHRQASKKWDNMKKKYKELKYPPEGVKVFPEVWPYFSLMDDAMEDRLQGMAPILEALPHSSNNSDFLPALVPKKRRVLSVEGSSVTYLVASEPEIEVSLNGNEDGEDEEDETVLERCEEVNRVIPKVETGSEQQMTKREQMLDQKEMVVLDREISTLDRERALLEREHAVMERERAVMEREKAVLEREKSMIEKDREALHRERLALDKEKARWERVSAQNERTETTTEKDGNVMDSDAADRKERFLYLFEKLVENF
ncbi:uncharacterized protein si:dkeyp-38g8.5 [Nematolebias whitei]|uniref:uncharacterized protein si:dkeyp-38g8.5 n=1 Tax=Nematolebias whitei TaxID=451745 RepID=UPI00189B5DE9|nr:uncharacterized protein si:dkeyp-38g8.5 [Nematolebias whitei]